MDQIWSKVLPSFIGTRLEGRPRLKNIISNTGWLFADRVLRMGVGLFVGVWVARYLGPEQFGTYSYAIAFVTLFGTFASLGLDGIVVRDIVREPDCKDEILGTAFALKLAGGLLMLLLTVGVVIWLRPGDMLTLWLVGIVAAGQIFQAFDAIDFWFQSQVQSKYSVSAKNLAFLVISLVKIILIVLHAPLIAFAWAALGETALGACGLIAFYRAKVSRIRNWRMSFSRAQGLLRVSWPLILAGAAIAVYMRIDQVMLGSMIGDQAVGIYSAAVRVSELWYVIPTVVLSSIYPTLITLHKESEERYHDKLKQIMGYFFWGSLLLSVVIASFSHEIINLLYGSDYAQAAGVLAIHIYSGIIVNMSIIFSHKFMLDGTTKISFYGTLVGAISNVVLNLWLIRVYGVYGAAISTLVSYVVPPVFQTMIYDRKIGLVFFHSTFHFLGKKERLSF